MASTYTSLKLQLMATGENAGQWGNVTNVNLGTAIEEAIVGSVDVTFASDDVTLTLTDTNESQTARNLRLNLIGTAGGADRNLFVPNIEKIYIVNNGLANAVTVKTAVGSGIVVPAGKTTYVYNDGTNVVDAVTHLSSLTLASPLAVAQGGTGSNTATFSGENITSLNASAISSGTIDNARTTASASNGASTIVARDAGGNFAAAVITADLTGNVTGNVTGDLTGTASNATVLQTARNFQISGGATAANVSFDGSGAVDLNVTALNASAISAGTIGNAYTTASASNGSSTIVARDADGSFAANVITATNVTAGNVIISGSTVVTSGTNEDLTLNPNGTGSVNVASSKIINLATPVSETDAATKGYVDTLVASGIHFHTPVRVESPSALTVTYNNGTAGVGATLTNAGAQAALAIDGITLSVNDRVLVYTQADATQNGVYVVTDVGSGSTNWVLTRSDDTDTYGIDSPNALSEGSTFFVQQGDTGAGETYTCNTTGTITFGTTDITFVQISSAQIYSANTASGLLLSGVQFGIGVVPVANGGTGSNTATFSGANITSLNASAISTGTIDNARTTASSSNGASTIVARDASGNFSAGTITATLTGNADTVTNGVYTSGSYADPSWITSLAGSKISGNISGNAANITAYTVNQSVGTGNSVQFNSLGVGTAASGTAGEIRATNNITAYYSDDRLKTRLGAIENALDKLCSLSGFYYEANETAQALGYEVKKEVGVSAQEVQAVLPEVVVPAPIDEKYLTVRYERVLPLVIEAIKELKAEIDAIKKG